MKRMQGAAVLELKLVLKADVQGSAEAVRAALEKLSTDEVKVNVIYGGVGAISESDIMLAAASRGLVLGFGVRPDTNARTVADREHVEIRTYNIIYEAVDDVTRAMEGLLTPESREKVVGRAEVRDLFRVSKVGVIGGCRVLDGKAMRAARVRVLRDSVQVYDGKVSSLKHFKNDAREVDAGSECGVGSKATTTSKTAMSSSSTKWKRLHARWVLPRPRGRRPLPRHIPRPCLSGSWSCISRSPTTTRSKKNVPSSNVSPTAAATSSTLLWQRWMTKTAQTALPSAWLL